MLVLGFVAYVLVTRKIMESKQPTKSVA